MGECVCQCVSVCVSVCQCVSVCVTEGGCKVGGAVISYQCYDMLCFAMHVSLCLIEWVSVSAGGWESVLGRAMENGWFSYVYYECRCVC